MNIAKQIKKYRLNSNMSQRDLGEKLGISQQQIAQYENGKRMPKLETIRRIADALEVPMYELTEFDYGPSVEEMRDEIFGDFPKNREEVQKWKMDLLIKQYKKLNNAGRNKAIETIEDLTYIPKYTEPDKD